MTGAFTEGLDLAIRYLEHLRAAGVRRVPLTPGRLEALGRSEPTSASVSGARAGQSAAGRRSEPDVTSTPGARASVKSRTPVPAALATSNAELPLTRPPLSTPPPTPEAKEKAMAQLGARVRVCQKCPHLAASRTQTVFGVGDIHSPLMFVGEAPGADEDAQGEPFVGRAGQLLTRIIETMGLTRGTVYIANILKCRPDTPGRASGNRKPTAVEMETCLPYLLEQIDIIRPRVVVALGATAVEGLFGRAMPIARVRGTWLEFRGIPVMPTYHPAYLLRNQSPAEKRKVWEDMLQVMERVGLAVTARHRGYFLPAGG
jgi:uracil-DNA glycosylase